MKCIYVEHAQKQWMVEHFGVHYKGHKPCVDTLLFLSLHLHLFYHNHYKYEERVLLHPSVKS